MRTLKNGKEVKYYAVCPECSSHLEYSYEDIQKAGGMDTGSKYIVCPVCDERIKITPTGNYPATTPIGSFSALMNNCCASK